MPTPQITDVIIETGNDYLGSLKNFNGKVYTLILEYDWRHDKTIFKTNENSHGREDA